MKFSEQLRALGACINAVEWVGDKDLQTAWETCERSDWMMWLAGRTVDRKLLVLAAFDCANTAWQYVKNDETLTAIMLCDHITREWCEGRANIEDVRAGRSAAAT